MRTRVALAIVSSMSAGFADAQPAYPAKPIRMVMSFPAGGPTDIVGRLIGQKLTEAWGQNVIIDNRPGGGGMIGAAVAAKSPPDGYTIYLGGVSSMAIGQFVHKNPPIDALRDFQPVSHTTRQPVLLMTHPALPVKAVRDYIALAKAKPGQLNYASSGPGGSGHLAGELFKSVTKTNIVHVPYRGAPPALTDLMSGQVQSMFGTILIAAPQVRVGKVRAIAITGPRRSAALEQVPTFGESGLGDYDASSWNGIFVPAGTPRAIVDKLNVEIVRIMRTPGTFDRLAADGTTPTGSTPEEFLAFIKAEHVKWSKVVREADIKVE